MTEKRCVLGGTFEEPTILDTQTNIEYPSENYSLLDFVNNLLEENEQLKNKCGNYKQALLDLGINVNILDGTGDD